MRTRFHLLLVTMAACALLAFAGCGGGDEGGGSSGGGDGGGGGAVNVDDPQIKAAIESCKSSIQAQPTLSDEVKADLEGLCDKAASGDVEEAKKASVEVCKKIVEESLGEGMPGREQALSQCEAAGK